MASENRAIFNTFLVFDQLLRSKFPYFCVFFIYARSLNKLYFVFLLCHLLFYLFLCYNSSVDIRKRACP